MLVCRTGKLRMHYICITDSVLQIPGAEGRVYCRLLVLYPLFGGGSYCRMLYRGCVEDTGRAVVGMRHIYVPLGRMLGRFKASTCLPCGGGGDCVLRW